MSEPTAEFSPDTVILVHGLWMTPRSWENWVAHFEGKGYRVLTPGYPGFEIEVEALRENPEIIAQQKVPNIVEHIGGVIEKLDTPPIIMGHSFGGTITQLLLARGLRLLRGRHRLSADRGRPRQSAVPGEVPLPHPEKPRQPAPRDRLHARGVPLRLHQHAEP